MEASLRGEFRVSSLDHRCNELREPARLPGTVWASSLSVFDPALRHGSSRSASPGVPLARRAPRHAWMGPIAPLTAIRRIVAAVRLWRGRARSRQELRGLSDHMLKDIGLRREDVGYQFPKPFWDCD